MRRFTACLSGSVLGSRESPRSAWFPLFFLCVAIEIDSISHFLLTIYIRLVYKQSSVLFSWSLLISALPEILYTLSMLLFFLSVGQNTDFTTTLWIPAVPGGWSHTTHQKVVVAWRQQSRNMRDKGCTQSEEKQSKVVHRYEMTQVKKKSQMKLCIYYSLQRC